MSALTPEQVAALVPQQRPFRFLDRIVEVDDDHILGLYTWRPEDCGYLPGARIAPPFAVVEMAAQIGNVAWCIYHLSRAVGEAELKRLVGVFTQIERASLARPVKCGQTVACGAEFGEEGYFRGSKLVSEVTARLQGGPDDGLEVFSGVVSGMFVPRE